MASRNHRWRKLSAAALVTIGLVLALVAPTKPAQAAAGGDHLGPGQVLNPGEWIASGPDVLIMQTDGNLVLYASQWVPLWSSITPGNAGARAVMQTDGNLVIYRQNGVPIWASNTAGWAGSTLHLQSDGNVVIRAPGNVAIWHTDTYKQSYAVNRFPSYGWAGDQWDCLRLLWLRESNWNELAHNPSSGAHGIPQSLPGDKMASEGADWWSNPYTQIRWGQGYIKGRYDTPCVAWWMWNSRNPHWY